jgi:hypothetical protein
VRKTLHQQNSPVELQGPKDRGDIDQYVFSLGQPLLAKKF